MPGIYPFYHSLTEKMAAKVISRIVQDGVSMSEAIKEAINYAELNRQQIIHLCSVLQDYGLVYNGDPKDYFYTSDDMGKAFPSTQNGYVVYANKKGRDFDAVFAAVENLRAEGMSDDEILSIEPELGRIISLMDEYKGRYFDIMERGQEMPIAANEISSRTIRSQVADVEEASPDNIESLLGESDASQTPAPVEEVVAEEPPLGGAEEMVEEPTGGATVTISPSPSEMESQLAKAPKWDVNNLLSIDKAKGFYDGIKKELEELVLNDKIQMGEDLLKQYNDVRTKIDEQSNKIGDAQKETEKLEDKKNDIEQEFQEPTGEEAPTEQLISEDPASAPVDAPLAPAQ